MRRCAKCGSQSPDHAKFCPSCGQSLVVAIEPTSVASASPASTYSPNVASAVAAPISPAKPSQKPAFWAAVLIVVVAGVFGTLYASGNLLKVKGEPVTGDLLKAEGTAPTGDLLKVKGQPPTGDLLKDQRTHLPMPDDVRAYLLALEKIEKKRVELTQNQLAAAMTDLAALRLGSGDLDIAKGLLGDPYGEGPPIKSARESAADKSKDVRKEWVALMEEFTLIMAPPECFKVRDNYRQALQGTSELVATILDSMDRAAEDPQGALVALQALQGQSKKEIDVFGKGADQGVADICDKYEEKKWFDIAGDIGGGSLIGG